MSECSCDILHNILSRLPAKDLFRYKSVCKLWKGIIDDPFFVKSHIRNQQLSNATSILIQNKYGGKLFSLSLDCLNYADDNQDIGLIPVKQLIHRGLPRLSGMPASSCNGLILITHENIKKSWAIWNPLVQDFHEVPPPPAAPDTFITLLQRSGFGYDEASDDYKVVRVDRMYRNKANVNDHYRSLIYSLKSRCWREMEGFPGGVCHGECGAYLNGALHWRSQHGIIALHLGSEDYHVLSVPPGLQSFTGIWDSLDALDGCLILSYHYPNPRGMDVWVMKDYEMDKTWTKLFSVANYVRVLAYLKSKGQVLLDDMDSGLKWLDLDDKSVKEIKVYVSGPKGRCMLSFGQIYPGSLVRLDSTKSRRTGVKMKRQSEGERAHAYARFNKKIFVDFVSSDCFRL